MKFTTSISSYFTTLINNYISQKVKNIYCFTVVKLLWSLGYLGSYGPARLPPIPRGVGFWDKVNHQILVAKGVGYWFLDNILSKNLWYVLFQQNSVENRCHYFRTVAYIQTSEVPKVYSHTVPKFVQHRYKWPCWLTLQQNLLFADDLNICTECERRKTKLIQ